MRKKSLPLLIAFVLLLSLGQPAQALTVLIDAKGTIAIHQGQILGDSDENEDAESEEENHESSQEETEQEETENEQEKQAAEQQRERLKQELEAQKAAQERIREQAKQKLEKEREALKKIKTVTATEKKQLKVKVDAKKSEVLLVPKKQSDDIFAKQESITTDALDIELPAGHKETEEAENEIEESTPETERVREIQLQRSQRQDRFRIKTQATKDGEQEVEIESGEFKAKLKSAEFVVDPETNAVTVISASGQSHTLMHLPDMAIQRMIDAGVINLNDETAQAELVVETKDDGSIVYKTKAKEVRRVLGLIPVEFENEVELVDASSETSSTPNDESLFERFLRTISR